uniref:Uncharacterized protein n=1 Tax=Plectus sambesii TaxID=2011161 RepID=A0A914WZK7_9BILA
MFENAARKGRVMLRSTRKFSRANRLVAALFDDNKGTSPPTGAERDENDDKKTQRRRRGRRARDGRTARIPRKDQRRRSPNAGGSSMAPMINATARALPH